MITRRLELVDSTRPTQAVFDFPGAESRRLDTVVWYPATTQAGLFPLIIYCHGTYGQPDNAMHIVEHLVRHGYMVAAPAFPLTSSAAHTQLPAAHTPDVRNQPADVSLVIDQLLANAELGPLIDPQAIGSSGHSLGGVTTYFLSFAAETRDPRIAANALIAGGDPVGANAAFQFGFEDDVLADARTPVLFLSADKDVFANLSGAQFAAYARLGAPKYELSIRNGVHVYFRDAYPGEARGDGRNPDCTFFETNMPGVPIPGCEEPGEFIARERQQEITRDALVTFFDAYLKHDDAALARLRRLASTYPETELRADD